MEADTKIEKMQSADASSARTRSTIEFPYLDLENAIEITTAIHEIGGSSCDWDQLAAHLKQAAQGGGFRLRMICAKQFGLITYDRGRASLTGLGLRMVDSQQQRAAKVEAFLNIPLYKAVFEKFRGNTLPPQAGLEREMVSLGVSIKQADKARLAFSRSAKSAGFFEFGADRLVVPANASPVHTPGDAAVNGDNDKPKTKNHGGGNGGGHGGESNYHPFIVGLLKTLPEPDAEWSIAGRVKWLQAASNIFGLIYTTTEVDETSIIDIEKKTL